MISPLARYVAEVFAEVPRLRFDSTRGRADAEVWLRDVRSLVRRYLEEARQDNSDPELLSVDEIGETHVHRFAFGTPAKLLYHATLLQPRSPKPVGTILLLPGRNARHEMVIGAKAPDFPQRNVAERLTRAGYITLTIDYGILDCLPHDTSGRDVTSLLAHSLALQGRSLLGYLTANACSALRWLERQQWVDASKLGIVGHSLGGHIALHAALAHQTRLPLVLASCASSYRSIFWRDLSGGGAHALPGILRHADLPDLMAALAPGFLQIQHGTQDPVSRIEDASEVVSVVRDSYRAIDEEIKLEAAFLPMGHAVDADTAAAFFERAFACAVPREVAVVPPARVHFDYAVRREAIDRIDQAMFSGVLTLGPVGALFEREVANWTGTDEAVAVSSGTAAIEVALRVVGVGGKRVLVPANTFFATASAAIASGATIDFVDMEPDGLGIDPIGLAAKLRTHDDVAAVIAVHIGGLLSPRLHEIASLCNEHGVALIEDAAHAIGSQLDNIPAGQFGRLAAFSFYPTKVVTSAEGGIVAAQSRNDAALARSLRDHGKIVFNANVHDRIGSNWRMSEAHAAIGLAHLAQLGRFIEERGAAAAYYERCLRDIEGIEVVGTPSGGTNNYYKFIVLLNSHVDRGVLKRKLRERHRIYLSGEVYDPLCCLQPALQGAFRPEDFPVAFDFSKRHICLPIFAGLTRREQDRVIRGLQTEVKAAFVTLPRKNGQIERATNAQV